MTFTAVALSGGVDSLTAALLLQRAGRRLVGIHFLTGFETYPALDSRESFADLKTAAARRLAPLGRQLGIPLEIVDCRAAFRGRVIDYFKTTYQAGRTPNPCMVCNAGIKFGFLMEMARKLGAERLATGHYARVRTDDRGQVHLHQGRDRTKDQSYFLARLTPLQLASAVFPLGDMEKRAVKKMAAEQGLQPVGSEESQDICFIRNRTYGDFLMDELKMPFRPGPIVDRKGRQIGEHAGLHRFTIGQRRGINCPAAEPYYVVRIELEHNRLVVGAKADLVCPACELKEMNWLQPPPAEPFEARVRIRYRHRAVAARIEPRPGGRVRVVFRNPQAAVTPGQGGVIYVRDEVLGSGWITLAATRTEPGA